MSSVEHVREYLDAVRGELDAVLTHDGRHSVYQHALETSKILNQLLDFYDLRSDVHYLIGCFLAYYHDLGKGTAKPGQPHSPFSVQELRRHRNRFKSIDDSLWWILLYLIAVHHGRLRAPKLSDKTLKSFPPRNMFIKHLLERAERIYGIDRRDIVDVFGLFKLADAISAYGGISKVILDKPHTSPSVVERIIGYVDEKRWREQLKLCSLPDVSMLRAPTGWGKTSVSLLFARPETTRIFILLPTITAINKFYEKLSNSIGGDRVKRYFYLYAAETAENVEAVDTLFFARSFLAPYMITTVDQLILSLLQLGRYHTRRIAFRCSTLIFDEIHLLSPAMLSIVSFFLKRYLAKYRMRCLLMSATFPNAYREFFSKEVKASMLDYGYKYKEKRRVLYSLESKPIEKSVDDIISSFTRGRRVLVIVNTVGRAIQVAKELDRQLEDPEAVLLIHARYTYKDRRRIENEAFRRLRKPHILVATQVCEVSLDISYDELFTELAPLGDIIQRFGRVNRYGSRADSTNAHLLPVEAPEPYDRREIDIAKNVLEEYEGDQLENEWQLIEAFDKLFTYEELLKLLETVADKIRLDVWEELLGYFFSLDLQEETLRRILEYRDQFTMMALPDPGIIIDEDAKIELNRVLESSKQPLRSYRERIRRRAMMERYLIPVPFRYLDLQERIMGFPVVRKGLYDPCYGLILDGGRR